jgi:biotin carboxylase
VRSVTVSAAVGERVSVTGSFRDRIGAVIAADRSASVAGRQAEAALAQLVIRLADHNASGE